MPYSFYNFISLNIRMKQIDEVTERPSVETWSRRHPPEGTCRSRFVTTGPRRSRLPKTRALTRLSPVLLQVEQDPRGDEESADEDAQGVGALFDLRDLGPRGSRDHGAVGIPTAGDRGRGAGDQQSAGGNHGDFSRRQMAIEGKLFGSPH